MGPDAYAVGNFMRTVNSRLALAINKYFGRDSQAIRERYKSKIVTGPKYCLELIRYIYANRYKIGGVKPHFDRYCSAYWRMFKPYKIITNPVNEEDQENNRLAMLLDDYTKAGLRIALRVSLSWNR